MGGANDLDVSHSHGRRECVRRRLLGARKCARKDLLALVVVVLGVLARVLDEGMCGASQVLCRWAGQLQGAEVDVQGADQSHPTTQNACLTKRAFHPHHARALGCCVCRCAGGAVPASPPCTHVHRD
jgi:hypothetical protein